jgi:hypothetical protein
VQAVQESDDVLLRKDGGQVSHDLHRGGVLAGLGDRYRFLEQYLAVRPAKETAQALEQGAPLINYIEVAQRSGRIRDDLDSGWLFEAVVALITQAATHPRSDLAPRTSMLHATVRSILRPVR